MLLQPRVLHLRLLQLPSHVQFPHGAGVCWGDICNGVNGYASGCGHISQAPATLDVSKPSTLGTALTGFVWSARLDACNPSQPQAADP